MDKVRATHCSTILIAYWQPINGEFRISQLFFTFQLILKIESYFLVDFLTYAHFLFSPFYYYTNQILTTPSNQILTTPTNQTKPQTYSKHFHLISAHCYLKLYRCGHFSSEISSQHFSLVSHFSKWKPSDLKAFFR